MSRPLISAATAAEYLNISILQLRGMTERGELPYINVGMGAKRPSYRYDPAELDKLGRRASFIDERSAIKEPAAGVHAVYYLAVGHMMKIGRTTNYPARARAIRGSSPQRPILVWWEAGGKAEEAAAHLRFKAQHSHLEWFNFDGELLEFIIERRAE